MAPKKPTVTPRRPGERRAEPAPPLTPEQLKFIERYPAAGRVSSGHITDTRDVSGAHMRDTHDVSTGHTPDTRPGVGVRRRKRGDRRRFHVQFRVETWAALEAYAAREDEDVSKVVDRAVVELLRAKGALP